MHSQFVVAGIDIGGTKTSAVLCDRAGVVLGSAVVPTPAREGGMAMSNAAADLVRQLTVETGLAPVTVGVGAAGVIDQETGTVTAASESFTDWAGFPLADELEAALGLRVRVENDVNAFLHGEMSYGALAGSRDALGITLGTGVGGAIAIGGAIFTGPRGAAGEIGHTPGYSDIVCTCGQVGHLETLASGRSISARYGERTCTSELVSSEQVADRARNGDEAALAVFSDAGRALALAIASAVNLIDLQDVVIGGGVRGAWDLLEPVLMATLDDNQPVSGYSLTVRPSSLGSRAVALGAAAQAWQLADTA
ncbi:ROK family protein [Leifsonia sp. A12D58]|uniref:ROK family protein n=1 Tax=Leifsonia sp. A12D58 TaxID=3397674 RepID=UPI0039DF9DDE